MNNRLLILMWNNSWYRNLSVFEGLDRDVLKKLYYYRGLIFFFGVYIIFIYIMLLN